MTTVVDIAMNKLTDWKPSFLVWDGKEWRECVILGMANSLETPRDSLYLVRFSDASESWVSMKGFYRINKTYDAKLANEYGTI